MLTVEGRNQEMFSATSIISTAIKRAFGCPHSGTFTGHTWLNTSLGAIPLAAVRVVMAVWVTWLQQSMFWFCARAEKGDTDHKKNKIIKNKIK